MNRKTLSLLLAAVVTIPAFVPAMTFAEEAEVTESLPDVISEIDEAVRTVPNGAAEITPTMDDDEIAEALDGANYVLLKKGTYNKFENLEFTADTVYCEDGVVINSITLNGTDLVGAEKDATVTVRGSIIVQGSSASEIADIRLTSSAASSDMTNKKLADGRLQWLSSGLTIRNATIQLLNNNLGHGFSCGYTPNTNGSRMLVLDNSTLIASNNKKNGLDAAEATTASASNITLVFKGNSKVTLNGNEGNGLNGSAAGLSVLVDNSTLSASNNKGSGLVNVLLQAEGTSRSTSAVYASNNDGWGMRNNPENARSALSVKNCTVNVTRNQAGGILLSNSGNTALSLDGAVLNSTDNKGSGLLLNGSKVSCVNSAVSLTGNENVLADSGILKDAFANATGSIVYLSADSPLINTLAQVTVTFNANGGAFKDSVTELSESKQPATLDGTISVNVPESVPSREGYVFRQWNTSADGTGTKVDGTFTTAQNTVIYAIWREPSDLKPIEDPDKSLTPDPETGARWVYTQEGDYKYELKDGSFVTSAFRDINGKTYYFNDKGIMALGLQTIDGKSYYFDTDTGVMKTGWVDDQGDWYYFNEKGEMQTGWVLVENTWYYMNAEGIMQTGWITLDGNSYFLDHSGAMKTKWLYYEGQWYFFNNSGVMMKECWQKDAGRWYYLSGKGTMLSSTWLVNNGKRYWMDNSGAMKTGWLLLNGKWYLMDASGAMITNSTVDGYILGADGVCTNPYNPI